MKSTIISVVFNAALVAIHGVTGVVIPINENAIKRNGATGVSSGAIEVVHPPSVKRSDQDIPTYISHGSASVEHSNVIVKEDNVASPPINNLQKRVRYRDGYPDISDVCTVGKHWAQTSNHPSYCTQLETSKSKKNSDPELWFWCYVWVACDVPNPDTTVANAASISSTTPSATDTTAADPGCHAEAKPFYFENPATCGAELIKGSTTYESLYPDAAKWSRDVMDECFESAGCEGGLAF
ncbi:MAG: hypothetical protein Q9186_004668 [Xanthomendoza sp. 1 TL-2023]